MKTIDIPNLDQYSSMMTGCIEVNGVKFNKIGAVQSNDPDALSAVAWSDSEFCLMPGPEFSQFLFRGENKEYYNSKASIFRVKNKIERIYWTLKNKELEFYLDQLPGIDQLKKWKFFDRNFLFDHESIAQHYGSKTRVMDFSRSEDVAMFFATTKYDPKLKKYMPMTSGEGVLYKLDLPAYLSSGNGALPLGFHYFPRPLTQKAFGFYLNEKDDIACGKSRCIRKNIFHRNKKSSYKYFEMFDGGNLIYPKFPFDNFFEYFMGNRQIRLGTVVDFLSRNESSAFSLTDIALGLKDLGIEVVNTPIIAPSEEMKRLSVVIQDDLYDYVNKKLIWRKVSPHYEG